MEAFSSPVGRDTPIRETEVWGDSRVHYWIVGPEGKAQQGEYLLGIGVRELEGGPTA